MYILVYPFLEAAAFITWFFLMASSWKKVQQRESQTDERQLGYSAVKDAVQAGMNVSSIVLAGLGVMLGWSSRDTILFSSAIKFQLEVVGVFAITAVILGAYIFSTLPSRVRTLNPAHDRFIATCGFGQLLLVASAATRFGFAILMVLWTGKPT